MESRKCPHPTIFLFSRARFLLLLVTLLIFLQPRILFDNSDSNDKFELTKSLLLKRSVLIPNPSPPPSETPALHPPGQSIAQAPLFLASRIFLAARRAIDCPLLNRYFRKPGIVEGRFVNLFNTLVLAGLIALFWKFLVKRGYSEKTALKTCALLSLCTILFPYARGNFSEPLVALCLFGSFFLISDLPGDRGGWGRSLGAGLCSAGAIITRGEMIFPAVILGFYLYARIARKEGKKSGNESSLKKILHPLKNPEQLRFIGLYFLGCAFGLFLLLLYNRARYGEWFSFGYKAGYFTTPLWIGLYQLVLSPGKGYFVYSPVMLLCILGGRRYFRRYPLEGGLVLAFTGWFLLFYSSWFLPSGDISWGPRFLVPLTPFLGLFLAPVFAGRGEAASAGDVLRRSPFRKMAIALVFLSVMANLLEAGTWYAFAWCNTARERGIPIHLGDKEYMDYMARQHYSFIESPLRMQAEYILRGQINLLFLKQKGRYWWPRFSGCLLLVFLAFQLVYAYQIKYRNKKSSPLNLRE